MKQSFLRLTVLLAIVLVAFLLVTGQAHAARTPVSIVVDTDPGTWGGATVTVRVDTDGTGEDNDWQSTSYRYDGAGDWRCLDHEPDYTSGGQHQETYTLWVPADTASGSYTLNMRAHSDDNCTGDVTVFPAELEPTITTSADNPPFPEVCGLDVILILDESASIAGGAGAIDIRTNVRTGASNFWDSLLGTGSTMSIIEFNRDGRVVAATQPPLPVVSTNTATFDTYIEGVGGTPDTRYEPASYAGANCTNNICATNWQAAFLAAGTINSPAKTLAVFFTDGLPTTNNAFPTSDAGTNYSANAALNHRNVGFAAYAASTLKAAGTRVLAVGIANPSDPTEFLPNVSGPTPYNSSSPNIAEADYTTTTAGDFGDALRAITLEACRASVTVNKLVKTGPNSDDFELADGWEFAATASPTGSPFTWTEPAVSTNATISALTGSGSNSTGSLLFQWDPESPLTPTTISINETVPSGATFLNATCRNSVTQEVVINGQTTLPVSFDVGAEEFFVCEFRNDPGATAVALGSIEAGAPDTALPAAALLLVLALVSALAALRRRRT